MTRPAAEQLESLLARVMRLLSMHDDVAHDDHSGIALTNAETALILELMDAGETTQRQLAERLGVDKSRVSRVCAALERKRLLGRERDESNRRNLIVNLTPSGAAAGRRLHKFWRRRHERMLTAMTPQERHALLLGLNALARELAAMHGISPASVGASAAATASSGRATPRR